MSDAAIHSRPFEYPASGRVRTGTLFQSSRDGTAPRPAVVVVHGLFVNRSLPEIDLFCRRLAEAFDVVSVDMRGHGEGPGLFTWGREEQADLADLIRFLRALHPSIGVAGFSFGGDVAIFSVALARQRQDAVLPDAVCTIGAPAHLDLWRYRLRPLGWAAHVKMILRHGRRRFVPGWPRLRWRRAVDLVGAVSPIPLLIIHGEADWLVHPAQASQLYAAAGPPKDLILLPGLAHAEQMMAQDPDALVRPVMEFFTRALAGAAPVTAGGGSPEVSFTRDRS